ncbi:hypothetical protein MTO96_033107 [Rhipicephalus appendiculatus]
MIYFVVGIGLLLGLSSFSVCADGLQINEPGCGMSTRGMIVNGTAAKRNQFPWMVSLTARLRTKEAFCGGKHPNQAPHSHGCGMHVHSFER